MGKWQDVYEKRWKSFTTDVLRANFGRDYLSYEVTTADRYELREQLRAMGSRFDPFDVDTPKAPAPGSESRHRRSSVRFQTPVKTTQKPYRSPYVAVKHAPVQESENDSDLSFPATQVLPGSDAGSEIASQTSVGSYVYSTPQPKPAEGSARRRQRSPANAVSSVERQKKRSSVLNNSTARSSTSTFPAFTPHDLSGDRTRLSDSASFTLRRRLQSVSPINRPRFSIGSASGGDATSETSAEAEESAVLFAVHTPPDGVSMTRPNARTPRPKARRYQPPRQQEPEEEEAVEDLDVSMQSMHLEDEDEGDDSGIQGVAVALDFNDASDDDDDVEEEVVPATAEAMEIDDEEEMELDTTVIKSTGLRRWGQWTDVAIASDTESAGASQSQPQPEAPLNNEVIEIDDDGDYAESQHSANIEMERAATRPAVDAAKDLSMDQILKLRLQQAGLELSQDDDEENSLTAKLLNPLDSTDPSMDKPSSPAAATFSPTASSSSSSSPPPPSALRARATQRKTQQRKKQKRKLYYRTKLPLPVETVSTHAAARRRERRRQRLTQRLHANANTSPECRVELAPYQREAVDWMLQREEERPGTTTDGSISSRGQREAYYDRLTASVRGGILADDMGLGKTVCCLALICESLHRQKQQQKQSNNNSSSTSTSNMPSRKPPTLIVTPLSILSQWEKELRDKTTLSVLSYHGPTRKHLKSVVEFMGVDVVLSTYDTVRLLECKVAKRGSSSHHRPSQDQEDPGQHSSQDVVEMAEALHDSREWHTVPRRRPASAQSSRGSKLHQMAWHRVILDESHVITNASCARATAVLLLQSKRRWCVTGTPIQNSGKDLSAMLQFLGVRKSVSDSGSSEELGRVLARVMLRRLKTTLDSETRAPIVALPPKTERVVLLPFASEIERAFYLLLHRSTKRRVAELLHEGGAQMMHVFELLLRLRQCCDAYALVSADPRRELRAAHAETLGAIGTLRGEDVALLARASKQEALPSESTKTTALVAELLAMKRRGERGLVVSQWTSYLDVVADALLQSQRRRGGEVLEERSKLAFLRLDGSMSAREREQVVARFQSADSTVDVLLLSLRAGGLGLNLTAASCVFIMEPSWNPSVERQAVDRAHRVGQRRAVTVVRFVMKHSIEQRVVELQRKKTALAVETLGDAEEEAEEEELPPPALTRDQLVELLEEEEEEEEIWQQLE